MTMYCGKISLVLCLVGAVSFINGSPNSENTVYFPNPNGDGTLMPAVLTATKESDEITANARADSVRFLLYTKNNQQNFDQILIGNLDSVESSRYINGAPVLLLIHGWGGNYDNTFPWNLRGRLVDPRNAVDYNVILMEWSVLADGSNYIAAVNNMQIASEQATLLLKFLVDNGKTTWDNVHIIGFSLGGQMAGQIGWRVQGRGGMINQITALDPALPIFDVANPANRTGPEDATFVSVIHTSGGKLGYLDPIGHVDFYPAGGRFQPGCGADLTGSCAHSRAPAMYTESVFAALSQEFWGRECPSYADYQSGVCAGNRPLVMGHYTPFGSTGIFYLGSNAEAPFGQGP